MSTLFEMPPEFSLSLYRHLKDGSHAMWGALSWPDDTRLIWQWAPDNRSYIEASLENVNGLIEAGWECLGPWQQAFDELTILRLYGQLSDVRIMNKGTSGQYDAWARSADIAHVKSAPVILAFFATGDDVTIRQPETMLRGRDLIPPPQFGELGLFEMHDKKGETVLSPLEAKAVGGETHAAQQRLSAALTEMASPEMHALASKSPRGWLERWNEVRSMAQQLAAVYQRQIRRHQLAGVPDIFDSDGRTRIPSIMPVHTILAAFSAAAAGGWGRTNAKIPTYTQETKGHQTMLQIKNDQGDGELAESGLLDEEQVASLWAQVREYTDLDGDIFLIMLGHSTLATPDDPDGVWITASQILDYRDRQPKTTRDEHGRLRRAGHREEDLRQIAACVARQERQWVRVRTMRGDSAKSMAAALGLGPGRGRQQAIVGSNKKRRSKLPDDGGKYFTQESRLTVITDTIWQHELVPPAIPDAERAPNFPVAWRFKMGTWLQEFLLNGRHETAWLCRQALQYDPYHEFWEKRLARYFIIHLRMNRKAAASGIKREVGALFDELSLPVNERNPAHTRTQFERALERLVHDGVIEGWNYVQGNAELPARRWVATWRTWQISVRASTDGTFILPTVSAQALPDSSELHQDHAALVRVLRAEE